MNMNFSINRIIPVSKVHIAAHGLGVDAELLKK